MNDDAVFRWVLLAGMLLVFPVAAYHRIRAHNTGEKLDRRQEGWFLLISIRVVGLAAMLALILYVIEPRWMAWSSVLLPAWLRWSGAGLGMVIAAFLFWTLHHLGKNLTDTIVTRQKHTLVTTGPYRWVRHPFYVCVGLAILANSLVSANLFVFVAGVVAFTLLAIRMRKEEMKLLERFGEDYRIYRERTGAFLPRF
jgi:protein-S-isoprenylcysteine O-methyltransferase Ste14